MSFAAGDLRLRRAKLRIERRRTFLYRLLPSLRILALVTLTGSLVIGGVRWLARPVSVGALEFTPHVVGIETDAVGVRSVAAGDMNGDGRKDVVTAGRDGVRIYKNEGSFSFERHLIDDKDAERVQVINLDGDDDLDLLVTFRSSSPSVRWYENTSDFNFTAHELGATGSDARAYAGDINGDNAPDIVTAGRENEPIVLRRWMNDGSGSFTSTTISSDSEVTAVSVGDLDNNGYHDIVTAGEQGLQRWDTEDGLTWTRVDVDDSNANRTFITVVDNGTSTWIPTVDHVVDEIVLYRSGSGISDRSTYGRTVVATEIDGKTITAADLDNDNDLDLLVAAEDNNTVYWFENDGDDHFSKHTLANNLQTVYGVATADLDNDGDLDVITADQFRGTVYAYERLLAKPVATAPGSIQQSTDGSGRVTFETIVSDADRDATQLRIQYSTDGDHWYKPWLTKVTANKGTVDLKNSNGYQVGTADRIDTNDNDDVTLTFTWDTKSVENTGGPIVGDVSTVQVRVIPRDDRGNGDAAIASPFRVDNAGPRGVANVRIASITEEEAVLSWDKPSDSSAFTFTLYYGTDHAAVIAQTSDAWDADDDADMADIDSTSTTVTGLSANKLYTFKLVATDAFGNATAASSVQGTTSTASSSPGTGVPTPTPTPGSGATPTPSSGTPVPPSPTPPLTSTPTPTATPLVTATPDPVVRENKAPIADAGADQVVNPRALVLLDGTASFDPDPGDTSSLTYSWRQLSGPETELLSSQTATASFSAGDTTGTYIFALTVRDLSGSTTTDTVTIVVRSLPPSEQRVVDVDTSIPPTVVEEPVGIAPFISAFLQPIDIGLFGLALLSTLLLLADRLGSRSREKRSAPVRSTPAPAQQTTQGRVIHYQTGKPLPNVQVQIFGSDGKLRRTETTNAQGIFPTFFPVGDYTLGVQAEGFVFAPAASKSLAPAGGVLYTGGKLAVKDASKALPIVIPLKPAGTEIGAGRVRWLHTWQALQRYGRLLSWPLFLIGALLNTVLVFLSPSFLFLALEVLYIVLVIVKIALEVQVRPAYGQVRDAITHIPLDLAVVRLFEQKSHRLIMTRVTNNQGKFFALPPAGSYTVTVTKPGYATFTKDNVEIRSEHDTTLQMTADLMPVTPKAAPGLAAARGAVI